MTDEEVLRTLQSMKPCVVNAEAQNEAIDRACEWGEKLREIAEAIKRPFTETGNEYIVICEYENRLNEIAKICKTQ